MFTLTDFDKEIFFYLWKYNADEYEFFALAKRISPKLTFEEWSEEYEKHNLLHKNKDEALRQFESALFLAS